MTSTTARPLSTHIGYGDHFTDHLVSASWDPANGWSSPGLEPLGPIPMHPALIGLHYAQVIFEGLKAHRQADGSVAVFRPWDNARRFRRSARRLQMPELPEADFVAAIDQLVAADQGWLSDDADLSLYLRPLMYASEVNLMLRPATEYKLLVLAFVAAGFFGDRPEPLSVWVSRMHSRAMPGGTGDVKCAANYGPSFVAQQEAAEAGCQQVIWLDSVSHRWVEELGGMNLFVIRSYGRLAEVVTPELTGTLLPGVTRDSLLRIAARLGYRAGTERITIDRLRAESESGVITEMFACGTAAVVTPIGRIRDGAAEWTVGSGVAGPVTMRLRQHLLDIQHGLADDPDGWMHPITRGQAT